jgi:hypothetical protein
MLLSGGHRPEIDAIDLSERRPERDAAPRQKAHSP